MDALRSCRAWIFDMDGTLTVPVHDFDSMRRELGLPAGLGTLEAIAALPEPERTRRRRRLDEIGWEYALVARPQAGALRLLERLEARGVALGLVTRNARANTEETLRRIGCDGFFRPRMILSRDDGPAKPSPEPILRVLEESGVPPEEAVVVGDAHYDVLAGRAAGARTVLLDPSGDSPHRPLADHCVVGLDELLPWAADPSVPQV